MNGWLRQKHVGILFVCRNIIKVVPVVILVQVIMELIMVVVLAGLSPVGNVVVEEIVVEQQMGS